jgi:citrate lyase beta subunit
LSRPLAGSDAVDADDTRSNQLVQAVIQSDLGENTRCVRAGLWRWTANADRCGGQPWSRAAGGHQANLVMLPAARAAGVLPMGVIGTVAEYQDLAGYPDLVRRSRRFGFQGASCIHPSIVPFLNDGFSPTKEEVATATRIIAAYEKAQREGRGSIEVDGKMIDVPVVDRAQRVVDTARRIEARARR